MISSEKIRDNFLNFFKKNNHIFLESSQLIPENDPSLLFTNAGMVQFKNWFTGDEKAKYKNVTTSQKCIRAGGKHNDLDNVGFTPRHHTFFEMLGNFSFGSYFKENAIELAWNLLTKEFSIDKKKLIITVFKDDNESYEVWKKVSNFSDSQIIKISSDDNFWSMGDSGPCGPCSEIFFDNGDHIEGGTPGSKNQDGDRFIEIWNLVFMQYEKKNNKLLKLPVKCVDTGMGLERISAVLNGKVNNFEVDIFTSIIEKITDLTKIKKNKKNVASFRIIADHIRAIVFLISEGILPSNEGRGYVLRRIIRRAYRHVNLIGFERPLIFMLVDLLVSRYENFFFGLKGSANFISETILVEEKKFAETLKDGIKLLNKEISVLNANSFPPEIAFNLYDTYGFPIDMTELILKEHNLTLNKTNVEELINNQRIISKKTWKGSGDKSNNNFFNTLKEKFRPTSYVGYEYNEEKTKLLAIIEDNKFVNKIGSSNDLILIFDKSPFYAESGGQVGDEGLLLSKNYKKICNICDTKKEGNIFLHFVNSLNFELIVGESYVLKINQERRLKIRNNHSATHLLHASLRKVLGNHIKQKGSLVSEKKLRFDYTNNRALNLKEITDVEKIINNEIRKNLKVSVKYMKLNKAIDSGSIALFGEKYPDDVRVISMNYKEKLREEQFSSELCGGTHVDFTGEIGSFKIVSESSVSSGVRRIEAITGTEVEKLLNQKMCLISEIQKKLKSKEDDIINKIENIFQENISFKKSKIEIKSDLYNKKFIKIIKNYNIYSQLVDLQPKELKNFSDIIKKKLEVDIITLITKSEGKISFVVSISDHLKNKYSAVEIVKGISVILGGKGGGGRNDLAQGGGTKLHNINNALSYVDKLINLTE